MILGENVQMQMFRQTAYGTAPGTPNGILIPRGSNFTPNYDRKFVKNPQVQADAVRRESALDKHESGFDGDVVPNLAYWGYIQKAICGALVTTGSSAPYTQTSTGIAQALLLHLIEVGYLALATPLFYRYFDQVLAEAHLKLGVSGIFTVGTKWMGTGNVSLPPLTTSLDATPTELVAPSINYCDMVITESGLNADIEELTVDVVRPVKAKYITDGTGIAKELRPGTCDVTGTLSAFFETDARWSRARAGTIVPIVSTIVAGTDQSVITLTECKLQPTGPKEEGEDGIKQKFTYESIRKTNMTATPISIVTTNQVASYD